MDGFTSFFNKKYESGCFEKNERATKAQSYAEALGFSTEKVKIIYNDELKTVLKYDSNKICIYDDGCLDIQFDPPFWFRLTLYFPDGILIKKAKNISLFERNVCCHNKTNHARRKLLYLV